MVGNSFWQSVACESTTRVKTITSAATRPYSLLQYPTRKNKIAIVYYSTIVVYFHKWSKNKRRVPSSNWSMTQRKMILLKDVLNTKQMVSYFSHFISRVCTTCTCSLVSHQRLQKNLLHGICIPPIAMFVGSSCVDRGWAVETDSIMAGHWPSNWSWKVMPAVCRNAQEYWR